MNTPKPASPENAPAETEKLPSGETDALQMKADSEHETGIRREKLTLKAAETAEGAQSGEADQP